ncbi:MAG TPA: PspC domain-containing protein [Candidatus Sulfotelmatobacter sp.]|nr:PspC domain-containing protein [Candidatus Sulfotelmatobacter sp.]
MGETAGGVLRRGRDRLVGGVCSGLAEAWHVDPLLVRVAAIILLFVPPIGPLVFLIYVVLWLTMPPPDGWPAGAPPTFDTRMRGLTAETREDGRRMFHPADVPPPPAGAPPPADASSTSAAPGATPASVGAPPPGAPGGDGGWGRGSGGYRRHSSGLWFGAILVLLGLWLLGANLGLLNGFRWDIFWPVVIIALGVLVLLRRVR